MLRTTRSRSRLSRLEVSHGGKTPGVEPPIRTRLRWRLEELRHLDDSKVIAGILVVAALTLGGFLAARASASPKTRVVTVRQRVRVRTQGHVITHWHPHRRSSPTQTVLRTQTIDSPSLPRPVTRYQVVSRKRVVTVPGQPRTVSRRVTDTNVVTVTRRETVVVTTTAVSTKTDPVPITVTVRLP